MQYVIRIKDAGNLARTDKVVVNPDETWENGQVLGDVETTEAPATRMIGSIKVGSKWATVRDNQDKHLMYTPVGTPVAVLAVEETPEEYAARRAARVVEDLLEDLLEDLESGLRNYDPRAVIARMYERRDETKPRQGETVDPSYSLIWNSLDSLLEGQARYDLLRQIESVYRGEGPLAGDIVRSYAAVLARTLEPTRSGARALSRSTSVTSNLQEDVVRSVASDLMDGFGAGGAVKREVFKMWAERADY